MSGLIVSTSMKSLNNRCSQSPLPFSFASRHSFANTCYFHLNHFQNEKTRDLCFAGKKRSGTWRVVPSPVMSSLFRIGYWATDVLVFAMTFRSLFSHLGQFRRTPLPRRVLFCPQCFLANHLVHGGLCSLSHLAPNSVPRLFQRPRDRERKGNRKKGERRDA